MFQLNPEFGEFKRVVTPNNRQHTTNDYDTNVNTTIAHIPSPLRLHSAMKIRLPFLWPMLWKSATPKPTTSSSTLAAIPTHQQHYPPKISSRSKRRLSTTPFSSTEPDLALPQPAYIRTAGASTLALSSQHGTHSMSGGPTRTAQLTPYRAPSERAGFRTSVKRRRPDTLTQRYGVANEPPPQFAGQRLLPPKKDSQPPPRPALPKPTKDDIAQAQTSSNDFHPPIDVEGRQVNPISDEPISTASIAPPLGPTTGRTPDSAPAQVPGTIPLTSAEAKSTPSAQNQNALGLILGMEPAEKPPHLQAPPYVHHFDTYTLVRDLQKGGFTEDQAITTMKAVRGILADNVELANNGILSKGDSEMVNQVTPSTQITQHTKLTIHQGNLPLPRRLPRTPHRNPLEPALDL